MPYVHNDVRTSLDTGCAPAEAGEVNYMFTKIVNDFLKRHGTSYRNINTLVGALECAKLELYRRVATPYEDNAKAKNGEVYTCATT